MGVIVNYLKTTDFLYSHDNGSWHDPCLLGCTHINIFHNHLEMLRFTRRKVTVLTISLLVVALAAFGTFAQSTAPTQDQEACVSEESNRGIHVSRPVSGIREWLGVVK